MSMLSSEQIMSFQQIFEKKQGANAERKLSEMSSIFWGTIHDAVKQTASEVIDIENELNLVLQHWFAVTYMGEKDKYNLAQFREDLLNMVIDKKVSESAGSSMQQDVS